MMLAHCVVCNWLRARFREKGYGEGTAPGYGTAECVPASSVIRKNPEERENYQFRTGSAWIFLSFAKRGRECSFRMDVSPWMSGRT